MQLILIKYAPPAEHIRQDSSFICIRSLHPCRCLPQQHLKLNRSAFKSFGIRVWAVGPAASGVDRDATTAHADCCAIPSEARRRPIVPGWTYGGACHTDMTCPASAAFLRLPHGRFLAAGMPPSHGERQRASSWRIRVGRARGPLAAIPAGQIRHTANLQMSLKCPKTHNVPARDSFRPRHGHSFE